MQYPASIVLFSTLIAKICFASLTIETSDPDESLVEASIEILESCYADRFSTVGIIETSAGSVIKSILSRKTVISTILVDENLTIERDIFQNPLRNKLHVFVVTVANSNALVKTLDNVKRRDRLNPIGSFLLIDSAEKKNECSNAYEMLSGAWKMDLLNVKFICLHPTRGRLIYTFNPYTNKAPSPWRQVDIYEGLRGHNWTMFVRNYDNDDSRCEELDFDKTLDLGGYPIYVAYDGMSTSGGRDNKYNPVMVQWQNVTDRLLMESLNGLWILNNNSDVFEDLLSLTLRSCDVVFPMEKVWDQDGFTYPIVQQEMYIMAPYRGHKTQLDKLISVLDKSSRFCMLAVLTITLLFFKFSMGESLIPAFLDLVRLICNAGLRGIPRRTAPRIYIASLFILVITIQGIYSGKLASLLTKNVRLPSVNSLDDVIRYNLTLYIPPQMFFITPFRYGFEGLIEFYGSTPVVTYDGEARLDYWNNLIDQAVHDKYHLSRKAIIYDNTGYAVGTDWPLKERVNTVFGRLVAGGIPNLLHNRVFQNQTRILKSQELEDHEPKWKPLSLEHLGFAFKILAIGLGLATMAFIVEVATKNWD